MLNTEIAEVMSGNGRVVEWASTIKYDNANLSGEDKEISEVVDAWARDLGKTGHDAEHELAAMITKAIDTETVTTPSILMDRMFDEGSIGEFDDMRGEKEPKNTIKVYESVNGGNVDRSFVDFTVLAPTWTALQAETDIKLEDLRRGGYKTVATMVNYIMEALEQKKVATVFNQIDAAITSGAANYISEATAAPTEASMKALALYMMDVNDDGMPLAFGLNKYIQAIAALDGTTTYLTDAVKNQYNTTGLVRQYAGLELMGLSGQKKLATGEFIVPDKRVFGVAGKVGTMITRGETRVFEHTDIDSEKIHIKVNGYQFGTMITDLSKVAKVVMTQ